MKAALALLAAFILVPVADAQECPTAASFPPPGTCNYVSAADGTLGPVSACTPGEASVDDVATLCHEKQARRCKPDAAVHKAVAKAYDVPGCGEVDHYIPLCLGGANSAKNLWCQQNFRGKDKLEARLCRSVCAGKLSLEAARVVIMDPRNWK